MNNSRRMRKEKKKSKKLKIILITILFIILFLSGFGLFYVYNTLGKVDKTPISQSNSDLGIGKDILDKTADKDNIINIALYGVDSRSEKDRGRSDSIIVLTVDKKHKKLKMTSIMRDSYVNIDGHGKDKINHAYAFGGPQLAIKTLNQNFGLNIKDFVTVDFGNMEDIIDAMGGIILKIRDDEVKYVNASVDEQSALRHVSPRHIAGSGTQQVDGMQALAYSRIRSTSGGDFERTDRQRIVLEALFNKIKNAGLTQYPSIVNKLSPYVTTSFSSTDMLKLGTDVFTSGMSTIEQERFPLDGYSKGGLINKIWYLQYDEAATKEQIYKYIFEDIKPTQKK
ncbi:transcriptional attenuator, LytR family [Clostridium amylolyticum]|uniref:Transcriptional attenuator, LytR family n=1 Tax=Clostridium amylolyticum TaxID=1121298 RepID=A0A1M6M7G0_9CLOT|nr:LCP family protein [Clostridium amylolyticum]SHJ79388.1 transcriptional attenuator, LytR family [Clostridium amylolyticum]